MTAQVNVGEHGNLHALGDSKSPLGLPSLRQVKEAGLISVIEVISKGAPIKSHAIADEKGRRQDWLSLLLRETLGTHFPYLREP